MPAGEKLARTKEKGVEIKILAKHRMSRMRFSKINGFLIRTLHLAEYVYFYTSAPHSCSEYTCGPMIQTKCPLEM